ncbi:MAG: MBL fold metallo-hydrolase [Clostridia bacterium]|nr:MBL fold metallo-hydrolase [Clostridia bacterium]
MNKTEFEIIMPAIGASSNRGALGWCNISIIYAQGQTILFDTGSNDDREELWAELNKMNINIDSIDIVFISHLHYDHCCNIELFEKAKIMVSARELQYVLSGEYKKYKDPYVPYATVKYFEDRFTTFKEGDEIASGVQAIALPGHTPGVFGLVLEKERVIFTGDAVKNAYDFTHEVPPYAIYDGKLGLESYKKIPPVADLIVPGHGRPFKVEGAKIAYVGEPKPIDIKVYPNHEHLDNMDERVFQRIIL